MDKKRVSILVQMQLFNIIINAIYNNSYQHTVIRLSKHICVMIAIKHATHALTNYRQLAHLVIQDFTFGKELVNHLVQKELINMKRNV